MANVTIKLETSLRWIEEEPNGQECCSCGDKCYLFPVKRMEITVKPMMSVFMIDPVICQSCFELTQGG